MKKILSLIFVLICCVGASAQNDIIYSKNDSIKIERLLRDAEKMPADINPVLYFARKFIGVPYVAHTLETKGKEKLVINTCQLDCLTLVETATTLAMCHAKNVRSFEDYCKMLKNIRYRGGVMDGYASRIHYFSEWITDNKSKGYIDTVEFSSVPFTVQEKVNVWFMGKYPEKYKKLVGNKKDIALIRDMEKHVSGKYFRYIPKNEIKDNAIMRSTIHNGDILAIVTSHAGLDIAHVGIAVWHNDGLHLLNASSIHHKVVEEPLTLHQYMQKHPSQKGIRVVRPILK